MEKTPCEPQVGADIEAFVYCTPNKTYVPCVQLLPGTKDNPAPLKKLPDGFAVQEDNVMAEFNIPPCRHPMDFTDAIMTATGAVQALLPPDHVLRFEPSVLFKPKDLTSDQAKTIGCEPDFDAYTGGTVRINPPSLSLWRGAGGHIHLGGDFRCPEFVAALFAEAFIGVVGNQGYIQGDKRAVWYGQPGIYRPKPYGIEYRTPSSSWAKHPDTTEYLGDLAIRCARWLTQTEPVDIQSVFRAIKWKKVKEFMQMPRDDKETAVVRNGLVNDFMKAGLPL